MFKKKNIIFAPQKKQRVLFVADMAQLVEQRIRNAWVGVRVPFTAPFFFYQLPLHSFSSIRETTNQTGLQRIVRSP